ncbi:TOC132 protein [Hibiscus syriacus]|uniref:TOC132 protein n=1 Tax=Hibiscus syriacus TaxID=106335 RepID=A0A6A2Y846_HIBSY|nr:TOC132 protein [Hibiscus syriacus]
MIPMNRRPPFDHNTHISFGALIISYPFFCLAKDQSFRRFLIVDMENGVGKVDDTVTVDNKIGMKELLMRTCREGCWGSNETNDVEMSGVAGAIGNGETIGDSGLEEFKENSNSEPEAENFEEAIEDLSDVGHEEDVVPSEAGPLADVVPGDVGPQVNVIPSELVAQEDVALSVDEQKGKELLGMENVDGGVMSGDQGKESAEVKGAKADLDSMDEKAEIKYNGAVYKLKDMPAEPSRSVEGTVAPEFGELPSPEKPPEELRDRRMRGLRLKTEKDQEVKQTTKVTINQEVPQHAPVSSLSSKAEVSGKKDIVSGDEANIPVIREREIPHTPVPSSSVRSVNSATPSHLLALGVLLPAGQGPHNVVVAQVLYRLGVGKVLLLIQYLMKLSFGTDAFQTGTKKVQDVVGTVHGIKVRIIDTPGLLPSWSDQRQNEKTLHSVKSFIKKTPPDIVLYLDRLDMQTRDFGDMPLLHTITEIFGPSIWFNAIVVLTHAASAPPDGPNGAVSSYDIGDHSACRTNRAGQRVLPNGQVWKPHLLLLSFASKILAEANTLLKLQDTPMGKPFATQSRTPPLPFLLSSLLQSRPQVKLPEEQQYDDEDDLDDDLVESSDSEDESEYNELPPFKRLTKAQEDEEENGSSSKVSQVSMVTMQKKKTVVLLLFQFLARFGIACFFDSDNPTHRYRYLDSSNPWLVRPVLDTHGWDHDVGYEGINVERLFVAKNNFPISFSSQITKDKKDANVQMELASSLKHGEGKATSVGFDMLTVGKDLAYTLRGETRFSNFRRNKANAGISVTLLGDTLSAGVKVEDKVIANKRFQVVMTGGAMSSRGDIAFGGQLGSTIEGQRLPSGSLLVYTRAFCHGLARRSCCWMQYTVASSCWTGDVVPGDVGPQVNVIVSKVVAQENVALADELSGGKEVPEIVITGETEVPRDENDGNMKFDTVIEKHAHGDSGTESLEGTLADKILETLEVAKVDFVDMPLLCNITEIFGLSIWFNAIVVPTHAASVPPNGPNGTASSYDMLDTQSAHFVQQSFLQAAGDMRFMNPASSVENQSAIQNKPGRPESVAKWSGKPFATQTWTPPLPFLLSPLLQSRPQYKSEFDELPPFKRLTKAQKKAYFDELEYTETLFFLMKKQLKEEKKQRKMMKKMAAAAKDQPSESGDNAEESGGASSVPVPIPDLALPASYDSNNPTHRLMGHGYGYLDSSNPWLVRPVLVSLLDILHKVTFVLSDCKFLAIV